jgi:hypothetical protein
MGTAIVIRNSRREGEDVRGIGDPPGRAEANPVWAVYSGPVC